VICCRKDTTQSQRPGLRADAQWLSTTLLSSFTYEPFGPITGWTWGNGAAASRGFDTDGKITQVDNANGASLKNYAYDDAFRITGITDAANSALSWTYGYDSLDRLSSAGNASTTQGWTYDANGNRLTETGTTPSTYTNSGASNRVSTISGSLPRTYGYDAAGNTLAYAGASFTYNHRGRMASASNGGVTATYTYNALGQRIRRATPTVTTLYVYDEAGHLAGEYTAAGALIQETVWLGDMPVATLRPNGSGCVEVFYVHVDHLNTPRLVTDTSNNIRWRWDSDPFGTTAPNENPSGLGTFVYNLRFPGQQYDAVLGLHYNYFRDYDPGIGRYAQSDPIGLAGGVNSYVYVAGNPLTQIDSNGLEYGAVYSAEYQQLSRYGAMVHMGPPSVPSELKSVLCRFISQCQGDFDCVYTELNHARRGGGPRGSPANPKTWNDPMLRSAENYAAAAAPNSGIDYAGMGHTAAGITLYQFVVKPIVYPAIGKPTTPVSADAWSAGMAGRWWYGRTDHAAALDWCGICAK
jgi:RHS repeat-associated protein